MINYKNPPCNPKTELECMSCRRYFVLRHDRYHPDYDGIDFEAHFEACKFCQEWVRAYNSDPNSMHNLYRPLDLWESERKTEEKPSELDKQMRKALEEEYGW